MTTQTDTGTAAPSAAGSTPALPPTTPCSVVWSQGRPYVLEGVAGRPRWMGRDARGRPLALTRADLQRRGWSLRRAE
ncbi:hypothetical protein CFN78_15625 [Amycolatopsis antarctica]|uniref:Uncharacterized protein n=1 Tax=Amycolatopsis antarctica TaxID=1854586 RepID=A0A263D1S9_9PSEU|nr:hypothetical protein [Amycolatopsis antarctica]OZM72410.1 hypothetical protein CFN78_15625 [Amycolatopsis antarctica]